MQLNYSKPYVVARAGAIGDEAPREVLSRVSAVDVPFGYFLSYGGSDDTVTLPAASTDITGQGMAMGFALQTLSIESQLRTSFQNLLQQIAVLGTPASGTFQLSFQGQVTAAINWNDSAATVEDALEALPNVGEGNVSVSGSALNFLVTFQGVFAGSPVSLMLVVNNSIEDGSSNLLTPQIFEIIPLAELPRYPAGHQINVGKKVHCWVVVEEDVTPTSPVYIRYTANGALPNFGPGSVRASADTARAAQLTNARFLTSAVAGGLALVAVDL